jgi:hypothetical protein
MRGKIDSKIRVETGFTYNKVAATTEVQRLVGCSRQELPEIIC